MVRFPLWGAFMVWVPYFCQRREHTAFVISWQRCGAQGEKRKGWCLSDVISQLSKNEVRLITTTMKPTFKYLFTIPGRCLSDFQYFIKWLWDIYLTISMKIQKFQQYICCPSDKSAFTYTPLFLCCPFDCIHCLSTELRF